MQQVEVFNLGELTERLLILQGRSSDEVWADEKNALFRQLERAAASQKLRVRHPETMLPQVFAEWAPPSSGCLVSTIADVNAWLVSEGVPYSMTPLPDSTAAQPQAVPVEAAPVVAVGASGGAEQTPEPERRLARLRALGGDAKYSLRNGKWRFSGIVALEESEADEGHKRCSQKTIRGDLEEAAQAECDAKNAGAFDGLGQR